MTTTAEAANEGTRKGTSFVTRHFGTVSVVTDTYRNGGKLAVGLVDERGEHLATLSVNIPELAHLLGENEFFAKTWSENAWITEDALASGVVRNTGRAGGDVLNAPIWALS